jgi:hypothetical protein
MNSNSNTNTNSDKPSNSDDATDSESPDHMHEGSPNPHMDNVHGSNMAHMHPGSGKPRAADYDDITQRVLELAIGEFQVRVCTNYAFPEGDPNRLDTWAKECWVNACEHQAQAITLTACLKRLVSLMYWWSASTR